MCVRSDFESTVPETAGSNATYITRTGCSPSKKGEKKGERRRGGEKEGKKGGEAGGMASCPTSVFRRTIVESSPDLACLKPLLSLQAFSVSLLERKREKGGKRKKKEDSKNVNLTDQGLNVSSECEAACPPETTRYRPRRGKKGKGGRRGGERKIRVGYAGLRAPVSSSISSQVVVLFHPIARRGNRRSKRKGKGGKKEERGVPTEKYRYQRVFSQALYLQYEHNNYFPSQIIHVDRGKGEKGGKKEKGGGGGKRKKGVRPCLNIH